MGNINCSCITTNEESLELDYAKPIRHSQITEADLDQNHEEEDDSNDQWIIIPDKNISEDKAVEWAKKWCEDHNKLVQSGTFTFVELNNIKERKLFGYKFKINFVNSEEEKVKKSLYERIGGEGAVNAAVELFYIKILADERVKNFFVHIDMTRLNYKMKEFLTFAFGGQTQWNCRNLRSAHKKPATVDGLDDQHFDAVVELLVETLQDLGVSQSIIDEVLAILGPTRDAVLNRPRIDDRTLYERLGGEGAVNAAVELFYKKISEDDLVKHFFTQIDMEKLHNKQKQFLTFAFGGATNINNISMREAHKKLVAEQGLNDIHFNAIAGHLISTLQDLGVSQDLIDQCIETVATVRDGVLNRLENQDYSLFHRIGGQTAFDTILNIFYNKSLGDARVKNFFEQFNTQMQRQIQKEFLTFVFHEQTDNEKEMRKALKKLVDEAGLNEERFIAISDIVTNALKEINVAQVIRDEPILIIESLRNDVFMKNQIAL